MLGFGLRAQPFVSRAVMVERRAEVAGKHEPVERDFNAQGVYARWKAGFVRELAPTRIAGHPWLDERPSDTEARND